MATFDDAVRQVKEWGLSPTFAIVERYPLKPGSIGQVVARVFAYQFMQDGRNVAIYIPDLGVVNKLDRVYELPYTETVDVVDTKNPCPYDIIVWETDTGRIYSRAHPLRYTEFDALKECNSSLAVARSRNPTVKYHGTICGNAGITEVGKS